MYGDGYKIRIVLVVVHLDSGENLLPLTELFKKYSGSKEAIVFDLLKK